MKHLQTFLLEHPEYSLLSNEQERVRNLLLWANKKRYISLTKAVNGVYVYTQLDLEKAKMWAEKENKKW